jgi:hypothetical protein
MRWSSGEAAIEQLLADRHPERVQARRRTADHGWTGRGKPCLRRPARPAGLRPTTAGGHKAVDDAIRAQFGAGLRAFGGLRRRRNEPEYPDYPTEKAGTDEASETLQTASEIIDAAAQLLPNLGFF